MKALIFCIIDLEDKNNHFIGSTTDLTHSYIEAIRDEMDMSHRTIIPLEYVSYKDESHLDKMVDYWSERINICVQTI